MEWLMVMRGCMSSIDPASSASGPHTGKGSRGPWKRVRITSSRWMPIFPMIPLCSPLFLQKMTEFDFVIGTRYLNGVSVVNWPIRRLILSYCANVYTRIITGLTISDCTGGFKCFRRTVLESIGLDTIRSDGYSFQIEMNFRCVERGFKVGEIPIIFIDRHAGTSKMSKKIMWEAVLMVWKLKLGSMLRKCLPVRRHLMNEAWTLICVIGFWGWIAAVTGLILCSFPARGEFRRLVAAKWGVALVLFYAIWVVGMLKV